MKYLFVIISLFFYSDIYAQTIQDSVVNRRAAQHEYYMNLAIQKRKTARTLLHVGGGMTAVGIGLLLIGNAGGFSRAQLMSGVGEFAGA